MKFGPSIEVALGEAIGVAARLAGADAEFGYVEDARRAQREGRPGFLVRGYIYYNQIHFLDENGAFELLYTSVGDDYALVEFERLSSALSTATE